MPSSRRSRDPTRIGALIHAFPKVLESPVRRCYTDQLQIGEERRNAFTDAAFNASLHQPAWCVVSVRCDFVGRHHMPSGMTG